MLNDKLQEYDSPERQQRLQEKHIEIQKLLETNLQTLENRCELLEMQNETLRKDKEES